MNFSLGFALGLLGCLLLVALFAASEAALAATNRVRLRHLLRSQTGAEDGAAAMLSSELSADAQAFIASVAIAANVPLLGAAICAFSLWTDQKGLTLAAALGCAATAAGCVAVFGIAPRLLASRPGALERLWWVRPARLLIGILRPFVWLLLLIGRLMLRPLGLLATPAIATESEVEAASEAEIRELVAGAQSSGALGDEGKALLDSIFTFGDTRVHEAMIPRPDIFSLPVECSAAQVLDALQESGFSRLPLHEKTVDHVVGVLHARDALACLGRGEHDFSPRTLMRAPLFVPETLRLDEALEQMRARKTHLAIVIDEFGGTAGLLTVEDVLEELVGEIQDEHDRAEPAPLTILDDHTALCDARLHVEDLADDWGVRLPPSTADTVGGWLIERLGRAPAFGDRIETERAILTVHALRGRRPRTIMVRKIAAPPEAEDEED